MYIIIPSILFYAHDIDNSHNYDYNIDLVSTNEVGEMESKEYLTKQIITYIGNKRALLNDICEEAEAIRAQLNKEKLVCADIFSGSGIVARCLKQFSSEIIANDLEAYSAALNNCYLSNNSELASKEFDEALQWINGEIEREKVCGIITENYCAKNEENIQVSDRLFYTRENAQLIDSYRFYIDRLPQHLQKYFLARLLVEASIHVNTSGVFKGFYKNRNTGKGQFGGAAQNALSRIKGRIVVDRPVLSINESTYAVYQVDAEELSRKLKNIDIAYLDPPYNQHPYGSNYFMLNIIANNKIDGELSKVSGIPKGWNRSKFNSVRLALATLENVVASLDAKFVIVSYNNEGFITFEEMQQMLYRYGDVKHKEIRYNTYRGSRNLCNRNLYTKEYLFTLRKN